MTPTEIIAIGAAAVSFVSMCAAIGSAVFARRNARTAEQAKEQAKQAALLIPRTEAINHVRTALEYITIGYAKGEDRLLASPSRAKREARSNIRQAKNLADLVFGKEIGKKLDRALSDAEHLAKLGETSSLLALDPDLNLKLRTDLQSLIDEMNPEAALD
jgi:hypothetical protein